jgi:hypothetical protein
MDIRYTKGDFFLDKNTYTVYIFDGNEWWEVVPDCYLKKLIGLDYEQ